MWDFTQNRGLALPPPCPSASKLSPTAKQRDSSSILGDHAYPLAQTTARRLELLRTSRTVVRAMGQGGTMWSPRFSIIQARQWAGIGHEAVFNRPPRAMRNCNRVAARQTRHFVLPNCVPGQLHRGPRVQSSSTQYGPFETNQSIYLRPETLHGTSSIHNVAAQPLKLRRRAQICKSFAPRYPGHFVFRTRDSRRWNGVLLSPEYATTSQKLIDNRHNWYLDLGMTPATLRIRPH